MASPAPPTNIFTWNSGRGAGPGYEAKLQDGSSVPTRLQSPTHCMFFQICKDKSVKAEMEEIYALTMGASLWGEGCSKSKGLACQTICTYVCLWAILTTRDILLRITRCAGLLSVLNLVSASHINSFHWLCIHFLELHTVTELESSTIL